MLPAQSGRAQSALIVTAVFALLLAGVGRLEGQRVDRIPAALLQEVMPGADRFTEASGDPPVISGFRTAEDGTEVLHGYVFITSDLPPEQYGYSGPIEALVGMTPGGTLTGMRVTDYRESYMRSMGDFLRVPGFQEQFAGKYVGDSFRLWDDIEGISRVSISVRALSRGVRDSARRVASAYGSTPDIEPAPAVAVDPVGRTWFELRQLDIVRRFEVTEPGEGSAGISMAYIGGDRIGEYFLGRQLYERALGSVERRGGAEHLILYAVDGSRLRLFRQQGWSVTQDGDTTALEQSRVLPLGLPSGGVVSGEATLVGLMLLDGSIDMSRPFTFVYDLGDLGTHVLEYVTREARQLMAEAAAALEADAAAESVLEPESEVEVEVPPVEPEPEPEVEVEPESEVEVEVPSVEPEREPEILSIPDLQSLDFAVTEDESLWERTLANTSWGRVGLMMLVLALATAAFFAKSVPLRWVSLTVTLVVLGFVDGGFLSVSHITSGIWAGPGVYLRDVPLLLMVAFTLVTTLVWGRVFCGFLCPFGALQDLIDRVVPSRFQRSLDTVVHDRAIYLKYAVLAVVLLPPLIGSNASLYQYFEPFGTVFFLSPSLLLWAIAGAFLAASAIIPRFYCRYACPLGAALGVLSFISLRRIPRVEQCGHCKVCEQRCPTGAIQGPDVDFSECVRCNVCEVQLIEQNGVCRHEMETIRPRLVQIGNATGTSAVIDV
jgi:ferredoxin